MGRGEREKRDGGGEGKGGGRGHTVGARGATRGKVGGHSSRELDAKAATGRLGVRGGGASAASQEEQGVRGAGRGQRLGNLGAIWPHSGRAAGRERRNPGCSVPGRCVVRAGGCHPASETDVEPAGRQGKAERDRRTC